MSDEQRPHHDYSPSTLQSLEACPCWQGKQSETPHPRTVIGQISHGVTETGEDDPRLTDEDTDKIAECIDFYEGRKQLMQEARRQAVQELEVARWGTIIPEGEDANCTRFAEANVPQIVELKETYLAVDDLIFRDLLPPPSPTPADFRELNTTTIRVVNATTAGYIDSSLIDHTRTYAEIFDWKFGFWPVEQADNNLQGIAYVLGEFRKFPELQKVRYFFKQPNLDYVTDATITREQIPALYLRVQVVVARARAARQSGNFSTARAMVPACNFCAHVGVCPVVTTFACKVGSKFYPVEIPADITPTQVHNPKDTKLGLQLASVLEVWAKAFKGTVTNRVLCGGEIPDGYGIESRTPREIVDSVKYKEIALKRLTESEYATTLKPSLGKVEDLISGKALRGQKTAAIKDFAQEAIESGAIVPGESYTFLKVKPAKRDLSSEIGRTRWKVRYLQRDF